MIWSRLNYSLQLNWINFIDISMAGWDNNARASNLIELTPKWREQCAQSSYSTSSIIQSKHIIDTIGVRLSHSECVSVWVCQCVWVCRCVGVCGKLSTYWKCRRGLPQSNASSPYFCRLWLLFLPIVFLFHLLRATHVIVNTSNWPEIFLVNFQVRF